MYRDVDETEYQYEWLEQAECKNGDTDIFFPDRHAGIVASRAAKEICADCVVIEECLEYALKNGEKYGIWGGTSERDRRHIRRLRA